MNRYTILCTPEQTKMALELGAPIEVIIKNHKGNLITNTMVFNDDLIRIPTAEQMIGWLEGREEIDEIAPNKRGKDWFYVVYMTGYRSDIESPENTSYPSRGEATLAAIDAALDYLIKNEE